MTTQSLLAQTVELFGNPKVNRPNSDRQYGKEKSFGNVMDNSLKSQEPAVKPGNQKDKCNSAAKPGDTKSPDSIKPQNNAVPNEKAASTSPDRNTSQAGNASAVSDAAKTQEINGESAAEDTGLTEAYGKLVKQLRDLIMSELDISKEEFDEIMAALGLTVPDLMNPDNLKQFVLKLDGSGDISAVLTDENLANTIQNLLNQLNELQTGNTLGLTQEELAGLADRYRTETAAKDSSKADIAQDLPNAGMKETDGAKQEEPAPRPEIAEAASNSLPKETEAGTAADDGQIQLEVHKTSDGNMGGSETGKDASGNNTAKSESPAPIETFINNLTAAVNDDTDSFTGLIANARQMQEITAQIVERIKVFIKPGQTSMELQLNPENLGKINLALTEKDGIVTAHFTAQTQIAKEAIESQMQVLKENLNNQGIRVEAIEVTVSEFGFDQSNQADTGQKQQSSSQRHNGFRDDAELMSGQTDEVILPNDITEESGNLIDYTA